MQYPRPRLGGKVYVPSTDRTVGGLGTIHYIEGALVRVKEVPHATFLWEELCRDQVTLVDQFAGGGKIIAKLPRVA